jgi:hypothetical protein
MDWESMKSRFTSAGGPAATAGFRLPSTMLEIQPEFVVAARLDGPARRVRRIGVRGVEAGALVPNPGRSNIIGAEAVRQAIRAATLAAGNGGGAAGLLVSDGAVRAAVLPFETIPENQKELEALVRWKMKQSLPCAPEEVRLSYQVAKREAGDFEVLAPAIKDSVVAEYESALEETRGFELILPVTAALLPLLPADAGAQLLMNVCSGWMTSVVVCGSRVCFWRTREIPQGAPEEERRGVLTEAARVIASSRDHLRLEISRAWFCLRPRKSAELSEQVSRAISQQVIPLEPDPQLGTPLHDQERAVFEELGAPLGGLLMNH